MFHVKQKYDVIVVGAGHAGVEAVTMASRLGMRAAIVTFDMGDIGTLSCNPAMGGLGKGHLIREIDALGGLIGMASDKSGIQFKVLNKTRGAAVQGPRAQIDRNLYKRNMMNLLKKENIAIIEDEVEDIKTETFKGNINVSGIALVKHGILSCKSVVITTGTFLGGKIYRGKSKYIQEYTILKCISLSPAEYSAPRCILAISMDVFRNTYRIYLGYNCILGI